MFIGVIGLLAFVVGLAMLPFKKLNISTRTRVIISAVGFVLFIAGMSMTPQSSGDKSASSSSKISSSAKSSSDKQQAVDQNVVSKLKSDLENANSVEFFKTYYKQGKSMQLAYYNAVGMHDLTGKINGTAFDVNASGSRLSIYVPVETPSTGWDKITNTKQNAYVVIAKSADGTFSSENVGKNVTVSGKLQSRGDKDSGTNWGLYQAALAQ
jgi:hypothetical protein